MNTARSLPAVLLRASRRRLSSLSHAERNPSTSAAVYCRFQTSAKLYGCRPNLRLCPGPGHQVRRISRAPSSAPAPAPLKSESNPVDETSPPHISSRDNHSNGSWSAVHLLSRVAQNQAPHLLPAKPSLLSRRCILRQIQRAAPVSRPVLELGLVVYAGFTFSACHPLGPFTTSNCTCCPSCRLRNPLA